MPQCRVEVEGFGSLYSGTNKAHAEQTYMVYVSMSRMPVSRYYEKRVKLLVGEVVTREYHYGEYQKRKESAK
jgi:hypothetical protein